MDTQNNVDQKSESISVEAQALLQSYMQACSPKCASEFQTSLEEHMSRIIDSAATSTAASVADAYGNSITATGTDDRIKSFTQYGFDNSTLNWPLWLALYNDSWVFRRAIDKPAQDAVNAGITLHGDQDFTQVYKLYNKYTFDLTQINQWGALFGGSVGVAMFDGLSDEDFAKPINPRKIYKRKMRLYVTDRWYGVSESLERVTNMKDMDFGKPDYYNISFADGKMMKVHHSYVLRYEHRSAPNLIKRGQLAGWGYAEGSHILNELSRDDQLKAAITSLINKSLIEIIKMAGMRGVFMGSENGNEEQLRKRLEMVNWARSYNSLTFLDKDDEYETHELGSINGLSSLLETNMWLVAAALEMQGVLFGDLRNGLSTESDAFRRYAVTIKNRSDSYFRPVVQKLLTIIFMICGINAVPDFEFNSLAKDELLNDRIKAVFDYTELVSRLLDTGLISKYQAAQSLKNFMNRGSVSIDINDNYLTKLQFEEAAEILAAYKLVGKNAPENILGSQFPRHEENPFEGKLGYLNEVAENNPSDLPDTESAAKEIVNATEKGE